LSGLQLTKYSLRCIYRCFASFHPRYPPQEVKNVGAEENQLMHSIGTRPFVSVHPIFLYHTSAETVVSAAIAGSIETSKLVKLGERSDLT
jgi:hypothetical protein